MKSDLKLIYIFEHKNDSGASEREFESLRGKDKARIFQLICNGALREGIKQKQLHSSTASLSGVRGAHEQNKNKFCSPNK